MSFFGSIPVSPRHARDKRPLANRILDALLKKREIVNCDRDTYLHRWYLIRLNRIGVFIHKFVRSDEDRALHDHPWSFIVIPIWRGYIEHNRRWCDCWQCTCENPSGPRPHGRITGKTRVLPILGTRYRPAEYQHRVELLPCKNSKYGDMEDECDKCNGRGELPAWSIFIRFQKRRSWGFWTNGIFEHWKDWWRDKCGGED